MFSKFYYSILIIFTFISSLSAYSQQRVEENDEMIVTGISATAATSGWYTDTEKNPNEFNLKSRFRVEGFYNISECISVRVRITSGDKLNNEWLNTGIGKQEGQLTVALRHLYISADCLEKKNIKFEAGAVPVRNFGNLGLSSNGSVDGLNILIEDSKNKRKWIVSVGNVDLEASLFDRKMDEINHASIQVQQELGNENPNNTAYASISEYDGTIFSRAGINWALDKYLSWLKQIRPEIGLDLMSSNTDLIGELVSLKFQVQSFSMRVMFSHLNPDPNEAERLALSMKQLYGFGNNAYFEVTKKVSDRLNSNLSVRFGDAGTLIYGGISWNLVKNFKKSKNITQ